MLEKRPIVVNKEMIVLGGNMRLRACIEAGLKDVPVMVADWSEEKQKEFIIKDNLPHGLWDFDLLANEWNTDDLLKWGMDFPDFNYNPENKEKEVDENLETEHECPKCGYKY